MKKKEDIHDYITAHDAVQILSLKCGRPIRPDYIRQDVQIEKALHQDGALSRSHRVPP
jgi:hypothetical protein